jgi:hypothetical protein
LTTQQQTWGLLLTVCQTYLGSLNKPFGLKLLKTCIPKKFIILYIKSTILTKNINKGSLMLQILQIAKK